MATVYMYVMYIILTNNCFFFVHVSATLQCTYTVVDLGEGSGESGSLPPRWTCVFFYYIYLFDIEILASTGSDITIQLVDFFFKCNVRCILPLNLRPDIFKNKIVLG